MQKIWQLDHQFAPLSATSKHTTSFDRTWLSSQGCSWQGVFIHVAETTHTVIRCKQKLIITCAYHGMQPAAASWSYAPTRLQSSDLEHLQPTSPKASLKRIWGIPHKKNVFSRILQSRFLSGAARYVVRRPESVPDPQGTLRARRTQQKARRGVAGPSRQRHIQVWT
jgi:hypothetical protein